MRVTKISVTGLFGQYDHTIPLNQEERITIIHGPNGVGKTILLRMIHGLLQANFGPFRDVPLQEFRLDFDDGSHLAVVPGAMPVEPPMESDEPSGSDGYDEGSFYGPRKPPITVTSGDGTRTYTSPEYVASDPALAAARDEIDRSLPDLRLVDRQWWRSDYIGELLTLEDMCERFAPRLTRRLLREPPKWLTEILELAPTLMLRTDRLDLVTTPPAPGLDAGRPPWERAQPFGSAPLSYCSEQLVAAMLMVGGSAFGTAAEVDRTFPARLLERLAAEQTPPSSDELRRQLEQLAVERRRLFDAGFTEVEGAEEISDYAVIDETTRTVLSLYLEDSRKKLDVYEPLLGKMELMSGIINSRLAASTKRLVMDSADGFRIETPSGDNIGLEELSSGEKQQFLLFYHLIFSTKSGTLVLIDEPELSMHIAWQQKFLKDLAAVAKLNDLQFLIATHSPDIIYDRWDLTVELKGNGPDEEEH